MIRIIMCDNDTMFLDRMKGYLKYYFKQQKMEEVEIITFLSGKALWLEQDLLKQTQVVFLDIYLPDTNGMSIAKKIKQKYPCILLVLVTEDIHYAIEGYKVEAFRFLLKDENLEAAIRECVYALKKKIQQDNIILKFSFLGGERSLKINRILYIESFKHKMYFHMVGKEEVLVQNGNLKDLERRLSKYGFYRVHKSFLVNMYFVQDIERYWLKFDEERKIPIPKDKYPVVRKEYFNHVKEIPYRVLEEGFASGEM